MSPSSTTTRCSGSAWPGCSRPCPASPSSARPRTPRRRSPLPLDAIDVVLMDLHLGEDSGIETTRELVRRAPAVRVLVVTMREDDDSVVACMRVGARGYLLKGAHARRGRAGGARRRQRRAHPRARRRGPGRGRADDRSAHRAGAVPRADRPGARGARPRRARATTTSRSRAASCSARRPCATSCPTSSPSWRCRDRAAADRARPRGRPGHRLTVRLHVGLPPGRVLLTSSTAAEEEPMSVTIESARPQHPSSRLPAVASVPPQASPPRGSS